MLLTLATQFLPFLFLEQLGQVILYSNMYLLYLHVHVVQDLYQKSLQISVLTGLVLGLFGFIEEIIHIILDQQHLGGITSWRRVLTVCRFEELKDDEYIAYLDLNRARIKFIPRDVNVQGADKGVFNGERNPVSLQDVIDPPMLQRSFLNVHLA